MAVERSTIAPHMTIFSSIIKQLEYMRDYFDGKVDKSRMREIIVGQFAVREFEESDPKFAQQLMEVQDIASKIAKGLKV